MMILVIANKVKKNKNNKKIHLNIKNRKMKLIIILITNKINSNNNKNNNNHINKKSMQKILWKMMILMPNNKNVRKKIQILMKKMMTI